MALTVGMSAYNMAAQPPNEGPDGPRREVHRRMMIPPIVAALDANHDGTISAD
jgi:hypothetical protein